MTCNACGSSAGFKWRKTATVLFNKDKDRIQVVVMSCKNCDDFFLQELESQKRRAKERRQLAKEERVRVKAMYDEKMNGMTPEEEEYYAELYRSSGGKLGIKPTSKLLERFKEEQINLLPITEGRSITPQDEYRLLQGKNPNWRKKK